MSGNGRSDERTLARLIRNGEIYKWTVLLLIVTVVVLAISNAMVANRPVQAVAILPDGSTYMTGSVTDEMRKNQAKYETKEFLEAMHSRDAILGPTQRRKAVWMMAPNLQTNIGKAVADSNLLKKIVENGAQSRVEWDIPPRIVSWDYPGVRIYGSMILITKDKSGAETREKQNITVDGTFFSSTEARPSGYLITRFKYITDVRELNTILNGVGG